MEMPDNTGSRNRDPRTIRMVVVGLAIAALAVFLIAKLLGDDDSEGTAAQGPITLSEEELLDRAGDFPHPVYWVGPQPGADRYELTSTADGRVYVRYVKADTPAGEKKTYLTVGTYPVSDGPVSLSTAAEDSGADLLQGSGFQYLVSGKSSVYVVMDDQPGFQLEIFDPRPNRSLQLVESGAVRPVG